MAEPAKPRRPAVRSADEEDALAAINDHLGRFLHHADELLEDWSRFGGEVRARVSAEVERVGGVVEQAVDASVDRVAARAADRVGDEVAGRLVTRLADVGVELERVTRAAKRAAAASAEAQAERTRGTRWTLGVLGAAVIADVLLVVLLMRGGDAPPRPEPTPAPGIARACDQLARGWSDDAFVVVRAAGVDACGELAATVDGVIAAKLAAPVPPAPEPEPAPEPGPPPVVDAGPAKAK